MALEPLLNVHFVPKAEKRNTTRNINKVQAALRLAGHTVPSALFDLDGYDRVTEQPYMFHTEV